MSEFQTVVVRPKISLTDEDPVAKALAAYKISKFAGCPDTYIGAAYDRTLNRFLTGFDENHPDILSLPQEERLAKQAEILEERGFLEKELGVSLHHTNEEFWSSLVIKLDASKVFNTRNPLDRVIVRVIEAGRLIPTSKEDISNPEFSSANFYLGKEYEDVEDKNSRRHKERRVSKGLSDLLEDFEYAVEIANYLQISGVTNKMPLSNLDDILSEFLERKASNKDLFLEALKEKPETIRLANQFKHFKAKGLVRFEDGRWKSGKVALGKTEKEAVKKLLGANPDMQAELARLIEDYKELTQK